MKHQSVIWSITGIAVLVAGIVVTVREVRAPAPELEALNTPIQSLVGSLSRQQTDMVVETMKACIDKDPQARRDNTRSLVEAVAGLAESGDLETAEAYYALGLRLSGQQHYEEAEAAYRRAIDLRPDWNWGHSALGILLQTLGRMDEAEVAFRKAVELDPSWSRAHNDLAILLRLTGRYNEAETEARKSLELDPDSIAANNNYGNVLVALGRFDEAEAAYRKAIVSEPDHPAPFFNLACLACLRGRRDEVVPLLLCAITFDDAYLEQARKDPDLDSMRDDPVFRKLVGADT
ncbi:MAG: tetratricopeptide repeat protein [Candidatus Hydrogenedentes bacterium]|nr:tetratricopeptide repeat protein [Candidatus Hydrogenedentota bacterium]